MITPLTSVTSVPAMAPVHPPTEDDNGIIHQIAPVVIPRAPAVSTSVQQCPAVSSSVCVVINNNGHSARIVLPIVPGGGSP